MCGIAAIINRNHVPAEFPPLADMASALSHRGPDDEGYVVDGPVGLYHKRLSIIDLATGRQPMTFGGLTIVFNGEIYNYVELRDDLKRRGHTFRTTSDTEVILKMYAEHGLDFVRMLNGMFAFLIYDRDRRQLIAARDHFGVKPLYYWADAERFLFASEIKAILRHPAARAEADLDALRDYVTFQFVLGDRTLFSNVRKVLPGHYHVIDLSSGASHAVKFWEPRFTIDPFHTEEYFVVELRRLLNDAVRIQMRSDVPVGAYLSGGTDSSLVATLAAGEFRGRLKTFTGSFREGAEFDESAYAREVATACEAESIEIVPTEQEFIDLMPRLIYHMDEPTAGPGLFPQYMVARTASQHVKVCLGGQGGDEIFGGYARYMVAYLEQALKGAIFETAEEAEHLVTLKSIIPHLPSLKQYIPMLQGFWKTDAFEPMDRRYFQLIDRSGGALGMFSEDFRASYHREDVFARFQRSFNHPHTLSYYNKMTHFDLVNGLPALLQVEDRVSMASSLESRVPLLDYRICDLVASMPPVMKFKGGELKYILKKAIKGLIPESVLARKDKMGFPVPLHLWARGKARGLFEDVLLSSSALSRGIWERKEIESLLTNESAFGRKLWGAINLELWHRQFIDGDGAASTPSTISAEHAVYEHARETVLTG
ncbi:MAG TPA: asparagine synthase (glutamine-hydrolyzing) [Gemmatimonadaceae bacterium]|nr:asparagine synthase (glutamine-hydrolyzing) [Gemmatimonadaceae bacterium]